MKPIEIVGLQKVFSAGKQKITALKEINLEIEEGMFGLLGPNGAGKTTLMRILAGITHPSCGEVSIYGTSLNTEKNRSVVKSILGYLPQELGLYPDLSAHEFVDYFAILKGLHEKSNRERSVEHALELVGLSTEMNRKLKGFSGGMKRRVGIAQAIVNDPKLLIVDEPTAGLDPEERIRFRNLLVNLAKDRVVILSTHIVEDIGQTSQTMAVLAAGEVVYHGSPADLIREAEGKVWTVTMGSGTKPNHGLSVVSMLHLSDGVQYRLVGEDASMIAGAQTTSPGLEDAYVWLMMRSGHAIDMNHSISKE